MEAAVNTTISSRGRRGCLSGEAAVSAPPRRPLLSRETTSGSAAPTVSKAEAAGGDGAVDSQPVEAAARTGSSDVAGTDRVVALRLHRSRESGDRFAPAPAVWSTAPTLLFCLPPAGNLANDGADRPVGGAGVLHRRRRGAAVAASVGVTADVPQQQCRAPLGTPMLLLLARSSTLRPGDLGAPMHVKAAAASPGPKVG